MEPILVDELQLLRKLPPKRPKPIAAPKAPKAIKRAAALANRPNVKSMRKSSEVKFNTKLS